MAVLTRIKASTLVEGIVAMVIITIAFGMLFVILSVITNRGNPKLKVVAYSEAVNRITNDLCTGNLLDEDWRMEGLSFEKRVVKYNGYDSLFIIEVKAYDNTGRLLIDRKELVRTGL